MGREALRQLIDNAELSSSLGLPLCQDCGLAVFFVEKGEDVAVTGMSLRQSINEGMIRGYREGFLRKSTCDPFSRVNRGDNSPAVIHFDVVPGDSLRIVMNAEGASADNASQVAMMPLDTGWEGMRDFVVGCVSRACHGVCAPVLVGVGVGGSFELAALNAKKALLRPLDDFHPDRATALMEEMLLETLNKLGTGPLGLGGRTTCLGVKVLAVPCHPASMPLAVYIQCHCARRKEIVL
jgi:fumarate hydratase subunit alpha